MEKTDLIGLHHITVITSSAPKIFHFMTTILGLHLIKKTVNQDDIATYHLYFTDDMGTAGTDLTSSIFPELPADTMVKIVFPELASGTKRCGIELLEKPLRTVSHQN